MYQSLSLLAVVATASGIAAMLVLLSCQAAHPVRRLEVEYVRNNKAFADASVDYVDVSVGGKPMKLPGPGTATIRASGVTSVIFKLATAKFSYTYDRIESSN